MTKENEKSMCQDPFRPFGKSDPGELNIDGNYVKKMKASMLQYMQNSDRPIFLGRLAIEVHLDLARAHIIINDLINSGSIRHAFKEEKKRFDLPWDAHCFMLVK